MSFPSPTEPFSDDAVVCTGDVPFQYTEQEGAYIWNSQVTQQIMFSGC